MLVLIVLFFYVVCYHSRLVEVTSRLDFLWKQQAVKELGDISEMRQYNTQLLKNILPDHVANYFLQEERKNDVSAFSLVLPNYLLTYLPLYLYLLTTVPLPLPLPIPLPIPDLQICGYYSGSQTFVLDSGIPISNFGLRFVY